MHQNKNKIQKNEISKTSGWFNLVLLKTRLCKKQWTQEATNNKKRHKRERRKRLNKPGQLESSSYTFLPNQRFKCSILSTYTCLKLLNLSWIFIENKIYFQPSWGILNFVDFNFPNERSYLDGKQWL